MAGSEQVRDEGRTISFGQSLARSKRFEAVFAEGMALVNEAATYLDGPGRREAAGLRASLQGAYSAESMRLTTRLMQIASWLLLRRAIADGDMRAERAGIDRGKLNLTAQHLVSTPAIFAQLPATLQALAERSLTLQDRMVQLERAVNAAIEPAAEASALDRQFALLRSAFGQAS